MSPNLFDKIAEAVEIIKAGKAVKVEVEDNVLVYDLPPGKPTLLRVG